MNPTTTVKRSVRSIPAGGVTRGDIRLGGHNIDGDGSTLAYNFFPDNGDMVIDTEDDWFDNTSNNSIRLSNAVAHEHGHGLGLEHVCPINQTKLLEPFINTNFRGIQFDEIYTLQRWYGDPFEQHGGSRDNDSPARAKSLPVAVGSPFAFEWLSIDDNSDLDYYELNLPPGAMLTVRVIPSSAIYLEGEQLPLGSCSDGTNFDSSATHDLTLEILDRNSNVLASATSQPAGQTEEIIDFPIPGGGTRFIRVDGDDTNLAQLYRLEVEVSSPAVNIALSNTGIVAESHAPANGEIEPGETVEFEITLVNNGTLAGDNVQATLSGPPGFTGFTVDHDYGSLAPRVPVSRNFVFGLEGECGEPIPLILMVTADGGFARNIPIRSLIGNVTELLSERFDGNGMGGLPAGWSSDQTGAGSGWSLSTAMRDSPPRSVFAENEPTLGTSTLSAPPVFIGAMGGTLRFRHYFDTEASSFNPDIGFDGGVLELAVNDGPWQDILEAGCSFAQGSYTRTLSPGFQNPLPNRQAWSGRSPGWISTVVQIPPALGGQELNFRWRLGHDTSAAEEGWFVDNVEVTSIDCDATKPVVALALEDDTASEWAPLDLARLTFSTDLPLASPLPIPLLDSGSATRNDLTGLDDIILPSAQTSVQAELRAVNDDLVEGPETISLSIDPNRITPEGLPAAEINIADTPYGHWAATNLGLNTANGPLEDFDLDGSLNFEEYAWQTDARDIAIRPQTNIRQDGSYLRGDFPFASLPTDVSVRAEVSTDLQTWSEAGVESLPDGFRVPRNGATQLFLRYLYDAILPP